LNKGTKIYSFPNTVTLINVRPLCRGFEMELDRIQLLLLSEPSESERARVLTASREATLGLRHAHLMR